jgi:hypothetical protein
MEGKKALLFVNKKKQKNFANLYRAGGNATGLKSKKFFGSFFQKRTAFFLLEQSVA